MQRYDMSHQNIRMIAESITEDPNVFSEETPEQIYAATQARKAARVPTRDQYAGSAAYKDDRTRQASAHAREKGREERAGKHTTGEKQQAKEAMNQKAGQAVQVLRKLAALAPRVAGEGADFGRSIQLDTARPYVKGLINAMKALGLVEKAPNSWRISEKGETVVNGRLPKGEDKETFIARLAELGDTVAGIKRIEKDQRAAIQRQRAT